MQELFGYWDRMKCTVITFNYDVLVERATVERTGIDSWSGPYRAPVVPAAARDVSRSRGFSGSVVHAS